MSSFYNSQRKLYFCSGVVFGSDIPTLTQKWANRCFAPCTVEHTIRRKLSNMAPVFMYKFDTSFERRRRKKKKKF